MRDRFPGYFRPTTTEFDEMWKTAIIVPDANILLHLLRYGQDTRQQVLDTLRAFKPRVWVPYRVAFEFLRRWRTVDAENRAAYERLRKSIRSGGANLAGLFDEVSRHQIIDAKAERAKIEAFISELCASLEEAEKAHPSVNDAEAILEEVAAIIGTEVGEAPSAEQMARWLKEGQERFNAKMPPGYMDAKNKPGDDQYGDYFIWEEMIAVAKTRNVPVIFVSDDRKEDWILRDGGRDIGPRPELVQEFSNRTGQRFYSYPFRVFLERAKQYANVEVSPQAIAEIEAEERHAQREAEAKEEAQRISEFMSVAAAVSPANTAISGLNGTLDYLGTSATEEAWKAAASASFDDVRKQLATSEAIKLGLGSMAFDEARKRMASASPDAVREGLIGREYEEMRKFAAGGSALEELRKQFGASQEAWKLAAGGSALEELRKQFAVSQEAWKLAAGGSTMEKLRKQFAVSQEAWKLAAGGSAMEELRKQFAATQEAWKLAAGGSALEELRNQLAATQEASRPGLINGASEQARKNPITQALDNQAGAQRTPEAGDQGKSEVEDTKRPEPPVEQQAPTKTNGEPPKTDT